MIELIERDIDGAPETLARVLDKCPAKSIPPAIGINLSMLAKSKKGLKETLQAAVYRLAETNSRIGRALKKHNSGTLNLWEHQQITMPQQPHNGKN